MNLKHYYEITKPGIVYGNAVPVIGGYLLASHGRFDLGLFSATLVGISLGIASSCVFNNVIDRDIDAKMSRTKNRAVPAGIISTPAALAYGTVLGLAGFALLLLHVNALAAAASAIGFIFYIFIYSMWGKRNSVWGTEAGSIAGAMPPVVGYVAVANRIDLAALILFALMVAWQMPHFYAIAVRLSDEYAAAKIPALPLVRGMYATKVQTLAYIVAYVIFASSLTFYGYCGFLYLAIVLWFGLNWLRIAKQWFRIPDGSNQNAPWARRVFLYSLQVLMATFGAMVLSQYVPF